MGAGGVAGVHGYGVAFGDEGFGEVMADAVGGAGDEYTCHVRDFDRDSCMCENEGGNVEAGYMYFDIGDYFGCKRLNPMASNAEVRDKPLQCSR